MRVLILGDDADNAEAMGMLLQVLGHEVRTEMDPLHGMEAALEFGPALVLLDLSMPRLDGWALARQMRLQPELARVRLVAVSGYGSSEDRLHSVKAGFEAHLVKPVELDELNVLLFRSAGEPAN